MLLLADDHHPLARQGWEPKLRQLLDAASAIFERECRVRFRAAGAESWPASNAQDLNRLGAEFREKVSAAPAWLAIGLSSRLRVTDKAQLMRQQHEPLFAHILLPEDQPGFTRDDQAVFLLHELGHFLGAVHSAERTSVMHPGALGDRLQLSVEASPFDAANLVAMNLIADELRLGREPRIDAISEEVRDYLRAVYGELARRGAPDGEASRVAELLRATRAAAARYLAEWTDGKRLSGSAVTLWNATDSSPRLAGRPLFEGERPVRWVLEQTLSRPAAVEAMVEFFGGDCLPGRVTGYDDGGKRADWRLPPALEVAPSQSLERPDGAMRRCASRCLGSVALSGSVPQTAICRARCSGETVGSLSSARCDSRRLGRRFFVRTGCTARAGTKLPNCTWRRWIPGKPISSNSRGLVWGRGHAWPNSRPIGAYA